MRKFIHTILWCVILESWAIFAAWGDIASVGYINDRIRDYCNDKNIKLDRSDNDIASEKYFLSVIDRLNIGKTQYSSNLMDDAIVSAGYVSQNITKINHNRLCCPVSWSDNTLDMVSYFNKTLAWSGKNLPSSQMWSTVAYINGKFVALANGNSSGAATQVSATSTDGKTWTSQLMGVSALWTSVAYGNDTLVAIAWESNNSAYSTNGTSWTRVSLPAIATWQSVAFGNDTFVAISMKTTNAAYSNDNGRSWHSATLPATAYWYNVVYGNGVFVAISSKNGNVAVSTDGASWTGASMPTVRDWRSLGFANGIFVALAWGTNIAAWSVDGKTWTEVALPVTANWYSVTYGYNRFMASSYSDDAGVYSYDGKTWNSFTMPSVQKWNHIVYADGNFVAVAGDPSSVAAYGTMAISGNQHSWAIGTDCNISGTDVSQMCHSATACGLAVCTNSVCSCQRTHIQTENGLIKSNGAPVTINTSFSNDTACNESCATICAENAANNTDGMRGEIICGN